MNSSISRRSAVLLVLGLSGFLIAGCKSDSQKAADVTRQFIEAGKAGNQEAAKALLTKAAQAKWNNDFSGKAVNKDNVGEYTIGDPVVTDQTASVPVTAKDSKGTDQKLTMKLRKEDGSWRVYAVGVSAQGMQITFDFEHPEAILGDLFKAMGEQLGGAMKSMGNGLQQGMKGMGQAPGR